MSWFTRWRIVSTSEKFATEPPLFTQLFKVVESDHHTKPMINIKQKLKGICNQLSELNSKNEIKSNTPEADSQSSTSDSYDTYTQDPTLTDEFQKTENDKIINLTKAVDDEAAKAVLEAIIRESQRLKQSNDHLVKKRFQHKLEYIQSKPHLNRFYREICIHFEELMVAHKSIATGMFQIQQRGYKGRAGTVLVSLGKVMPGFTGVLFSFAGASMHALNEQENLVKARKFSRIGTLKEVGLAIEQFALELTLQYEIPLSLAEISTCREGLEDKEAGVLNVLNAAAKREFKSKIVQKACASSAYFAKDYDTIDQIRQKLEQKNLIDATSLIGPMEMAAQFVVAKIFLALLSVEELPQKPSEMTAFCMDVVQAEKVANFDFENAMREACGLFKLKTANGIELDCETLFTKSGILVKNENEDSISLWRKNESTDPSNPPTEKIPQTIIQSKVAMVKSLTQTRPRVIRNAPPINEEAKRILYRIGSEAEAKNLGMHIVELKNSTNANANMSSSTSTCFDSTNTAPAM